MVSRLRKTLICLITAMIFIFAGVFLVGCDTDYTGVHITASQNSIEIEVDEEAKVDFNIENAPKSFYKNLKFFPDQKDIVECDKVDYNRDGSITLTIKALRGGAVTIEVVAEDGYIYTSIAVNVLQHSTTLDFDNSYLYMSESTAFTPNNGCYNYDPYTTDKVMSYYYIDNHNIDVAGEEEVDMSLTIFESADFTSGAVFTFRDKNFASAKYRFNATKFDTSSIKMDDDEKKIEFKLNNGVVKTIDVTEEFYYLAIYDYSTNYDALLTCLNKVNVLQDLNVKVYGGYVFENNIDFKLLDGTEKIDSKEYDITVVPNDNEYANSYVLRIEASNLSEEIENDYTCTLEYIEVNSFDINSIATFTIDGQTIDASANFDSGKRVFYIVVSSATFQSAKGSFGGYIRYSETAEAPDLSVNFNYVFNVSIVFQPKELLLNGIEESVYSSIDTPITLYNNYVDGEGWIEFNLSISTLTEALPEFTYINIEFEPTEVEIQYGQGLNPTSRIMRSDFNSSQPFRYKGQQGIQETTGTFTIHVIWTDAPKEVLQVDYDVHYRIVTGVTSLRRLDSNLGQGGVIYIDYYDSQVESVDLSNYIYANAYFQSFSFEFDRGNDVVRFYDSEGGDDFVNSYKDGIAGGVTVYYLVFSISALQAGTGYYTVKLDNGVNITLTVTVVQTLKANRTSMMVQDEGDAAYYIYENNPELNYNDLLDMEILNPTITSENGQYAVRYGDKPVVIEFVGDISSVNLLTEGIKVDVEKQNTTVFSIATNSNGEDELTFEVKGFMVDENLRREETSLMFTIKIVSYSLLTEFALTDSYGNNAVENYVYFGTSEFITDDDRQIKYGMKFQTKDAYNFYEYHLMQEVFTQIAYIDGGDIINGIINPKPNTYYNRDDPWVFDVSGDYLSSELTHDYFDVADNYKYISYNVTQANGEACITKTGIEIIVSGDDFAYTKDEVTLNFDSGIMFYIDGPQSFTYYTGDGKSYNVTIQYSNIFTISNIAEFDLEKQQYTQTYTSSAFSFTIHSFVRQRNYSQMRYDTIVSGVEYKQVEDISLTTSVSEIVFTEQDYEEDLYVSLTPTDATSLSIIATYVPDYPESGSSSVVSENLVEISWTYMGNGVYHILLSAENFKNGKNAKSEERISGTVYIYPEEWGALTGLTQTPIEIAVSYRNGTENNRYIIDSVEDFVEYFVNVDATRGEDSLRSHYELTTTIDLSNVSIENPIGILTDQNGIKKYVGFSGSIVGTSQASIIKGINIFYTNRSDDETEPKLFTSARVNAYREGSMADVDRFYGGLFAGLEKDAYIRNITFNGSINITMSAVEGISEVYVGLITSDNKGTLSNVAAEIDEISDINLGAFAGQAYIGAVAGYNEENAKIYQNYSAYRQLDSQYNGGHTSAEQIGEFQGNSPKILAYYYNRLTVTMTSNITLYVGGVVGYTSGSVNKQGADENLNLYGYASYSAFVDIVIDGNISAGAQPSIYAGGIAGYIKSLPVNYVVSSDKEDDIALKFSNLTVGGEVDSKIMVGTSYVGGIAGMSYVTAQSGSTSVANIKIENNIIRTFLRGQDYVGGVVGGDGFSQNNNTATTFNNNSIEAVDDGRSGIEAAMIVIRETAERKIENNEDYSTYVAIGNVATASDNTRIPREYHRDGNSEKVAFTLSSYLIRTKLDHDAVISADDTNSYYGDYLRLEVREMIGGSRTEIIVYDGVFESKTVNLGVDEEHSLVLTNDAGENIFYMFYFNAVGFMNDVADQGTAQEWIENEGLNKFLTSSKYYPFKLNSNDAQIVSYTSTLLDIDVSNNITTLGTGRATLMWQSILNTQKSVEMSIFVTNYFDTTYTGSMLYASDSLTSSNITQDTMVTVYGNNQVEVYAVPSYEGEINSNIAGHKDVTIDFYGNMRLNNATLRLARNTDLTIVKANAEEGQYTDYYVNGQTITFYSNGRNEDSDSPDVYELGVYLGVYANGSLYKTEIGNGDTVKINVNYRETATNIYVGSSSIAMETNEDFDEKVTIETKNEDHVYYEIFRDQDGLSTLVQSKMRVKETTEEWETYINSDEDDYGNTDNLFKIIFSKEYDIKTGSIGYSFNIAINRLYSKFINGEDIYGDYYIIFYGNELKAGVTDKYRIHLTEAQLSSVTVENYSNEQDKSVADNIIVTSQYGLLEINLEPIESEFEYIQIANDAINYNEGAGEVQFTFAYETKTDGVVKLEHNINAGSFKNGVFKLTYREMMQLFDSLNANIPAENNKIKYQGKVYIRYFLASNSVQDAIPIKFNISAMRKDGELVETSVELVTKLANYVKFNFDNRDEAEIYYLARGLTYTASISYYGFSLDDITISITDDKAIERFEHTGARYELKVSEDAENINYPTNSIGYPVTINIYAERVVDDVPIRFEDSITIYIMEYVFNYVYRAGENEDIVDGMENGVISTAIGSSYELKINVWDYMEYHESAIASVNEFVDSLTQNSTFTLYDTSTNRRGVELREDLVYRSDYYNINGLNFVGTALYEPSLEVYHFALSGSYYSVAGKSYGQKSASSAYENYEIYTEFDFSVHQQSSDESPIPIESYEDLMTKLEDDGYYILLNDITLPNAYDINSEQFMPITKAINSFDGNGYTIYMSGTYDFSGSTEETEGETSTDNTRIGLFASLKENAVLKNITIELVSTTNFIISGGEVYVGLIAGENNGIITNCEVGSSYNYSLSVTSPTDASQGVVAGLVGSNASSGIITHSRSSLDIYASVSLSGFVGNNAGYISSSYFMGGSLINRATSLPTAGFVLNNSGYIFTSYVSGEIDQRLANEERNVYYDGITDYIDAYYNIAGFVYENSKEIENCYSNISLRVSSGASSAGFVNGNAEDGIIKTSFSTSALRSNNALSYGFAKYSFGTIEDAYYLSDATENINVSIGPDTNNETNSILALTVDEFMLNTTSPDGESAQKFRDRFINYNYSDTRGYDSIWFYNNSNSSDKFNNEVFNTRLELVAPNIKAFSQMELDDVEEVVDPVSGISRTTYKYVNSTRAGRSGTLYNPILISSAQTMERYILNENVNGYNTSYYRLINNIDYTEYAGYSQIYDTRFMGYIEGNNLEISGIHLVSSDKLTYAGLFAELGSSLRSTAIGTLLNFKFKPVEVSFSNTRVVGAIAGKLDKGTIVNVDVILSTQDALVVTGNNIVGSVVGLADGNYKLYNVRSELSVKANYVSDELSNQYLPSGNIFDTYSYAGGIVGVASGTGTIDRAYVDAPIIVRGSTIGAITGYLGANATLKNSTLTVSNGLTLNAHIAGGLAVGENIGTIDNVNVVGTGEQLNIFSFKPYTPAYLGGLVGEMRAGVIRNSTMSQGISISTETSTFNKLIYLGGAVGYLVGAARFDDNTITGDLIGYTSVGGLIGTIEADNVTVNIGRTKVEGVMLGSLSMRGINAYVGGLVGLSRGIVNLSISTNIKKTADITKLRYDEEKLKEIPDLVSLDDKFVPYEDVKDDAITIDAQIKVVSYIYGTAFYPYIGGVVGRMENGVVNAYNIFANISADVSVFNISANSRNIQSESYSVETREFEIVSTTNPEGFGEGKVETNVDDDRTTYTYSVTGYAQNKTGSRITVVSGLSYSPVRENKDAETYVYFSNSDGYLIMRPVYSIRATFSCYEETSSKTEGGGLGFSVQVFNLGYGVGEEFFTSKTA